MASTALKGPERPSPCHLLQWHFCHSHLGCYTATPPLKRISLVSRPLSPQHPSHEAQLKKSIPPSPGPQGFSTSSGPKTEPSLLCWGHCKSLRPPRCPQPRRQQAAGINTLDFLPSPPTCKHVFVLPSFPYLSRKGFKGCSLPWIRPVCLNLHCALLTPFLLRQDLLASVTDHHSPSSTPSISLWATRFAMRL